MVDVRFVVCCFAGIWCCCWAFCIAMRVGWLIYALRVGFCALVSDSLVCVVLYCFRLSVLIVVRCGAGGFVVLGCWFSW